MEGQGMVAPVDVSNEIQNCQGRSRPPLDVIAVYLTCILIWGTSWNAVRLCVLPGGLQPFTAAALRFGFAAVVLAALLITSFGKIKINSKKAACYIVATGFIGVVSMGLVYNAQKSVSGGLAAIIATTAPLVMAVLATLTKTEVVCRSSVVGALISVTGIAVMFGDRLTVSPAQAIGVVLIFGSVICNAISGLMVKRLAPGENPLMSVALVVLVSVVCFALLGGSFETTNWATVNPVCIAASAYLGVVGSVIAFAGYFYLLKRVSLMTISTMVFFPPVIAMIVDSFVERSVHLTATSYAGIAITIFGVIVGVILKPLWTTTKDRRQVAVQAAPLETKPLPPGNLSSVVPEKNSLCLIEGFNDRNLDIEGTKEHAEVFCPNLKHPG